MDSGRAIFAKSEGFLIMTNVTCNRSKPSKYKPLSYLTLERTSFYIKDSHFINGFAPEGGAMFVDNGGWNFFHNVQTISGSTFENNTA